MSNIKVNANQNMGEEFWSALLPEQSLEKNFGSAVNECMGAVIEMIKLVGPAHPATFTLMHILGTRFADAGAVKESHIVHKQCFSLRKRVLGDLHADTMESMKCFEAASVMLRALQIKESVDSEANLESKEENVFNQKNGQNSDANSEYDFKKSKISPLSPSLVQNESKTKKKLFFLSDARKDDLARSLLLHEDCLRMRIAMLGEDHPDTFRSAKAVEEVRRYVKLQMEKDEDLACANDLNTIPVTNASNAATGDADGCNRNDVGKKSLTNYRSMKLKQLIDLIDARGLNRVGLAERCELEQLLEMSEGSNNTIAGDKASDNNDKKNVKVSDNDVDKKADSTNSGFISGDKSSTGFQKGFLNKLSDKGLFEEEKSTSAKTGSASETKYKASKRNEELKAIYRQVAHIVRESMPEDKRTESKYDEDKLALLLQFNSGLKALTMNRLLKKCAEDGDLEMTRKLLEHELADVHFKHIDSWDQTPIFFTAINGSLEVLKELIKYGGNIHDQDSYNGCTPMILACSHGEVEIVEYLISLGSSVQSRTTDGYNGLHKAASYGQIKTVDLLLSKGASIAEKNIFDQTPIEKARDQFAMFQMMPLSNENPFSRVDQDCSKQENWTNMIEHMSKWPFIMAVIVLDELNLTNMIDDQSLIDLFQICGLAN